MDGTRVSLSAGGGGWGSGFCIFVSLFSHRTSEKYTLSRPKTLETKHYLSVQSRLTGSQHARRIILQVAGLLRHVPEGPAPHLHLRFHRVEPGTTAASQMAKLAVQPITGLLFHSRGWLRCQVTTSLRVSQKHKHGDNG